MSDRLHSVSPTHDAGLLGYYYGRSSLWVTCPTLVTQDFVVGR